MPNLILVYTIVVSLILWEQITEKPAVPEPLLTLALVGLGLSALAKSCLKKN